jgi:hypothetical protein
MQPFFIMKNLGKGALGVSERIVGISIISYGKNSLDLRPTWVTTIPRERIEFVSQEPTVYIYIYIYSVIKKDGLDFTYIDLRD